MSKPAYDHDFWESLWSTTLREHAAKVSSRPPNVHLTSEAQRLRPGRAVDAGCGHGAESLWLAAHGWRVTAIDFSIAALAHARSTAEAAGKAIAERIDFVHADLASWAPEPDVYDLVASLYVHVPGSVEAMVQRLARGVALGGTLLLVGHRPLDPATGAPTAAAGQTQVSVEAAVAALHPRAWTLVVAEERPRTGGSGVDAVVCARRSPDPERAGS
jgi:SAM-dependent methyltransferase